MLVWFVVLYLAVTVGIGLYASTRVHSAKDFASAGGSMPLPVVTAMVFATWFGSEAVLGIPSTFLQEGFSGIVEDPFGSFGCLMLVGLLFAKRLYRMNLLTIGDFFRNRYGNTVEGIISAVIILSYLGWIAAQMTALGVVFNVLSEGAISTTQGTMLGAVIVLFYTLCGGMLSVAFTDFLQMSVIVGGLIYLVYLVSGMAGGFDVVVAKAASENKLTFIHDTSPKGIVAFIAAALTMMLGSIPQQDVYQRVMSAKNEKVAVQGSVLGAFMYLTFCMLPIFLATAASLIDPKMVATEMGIDPQMVLPRLILDKTPLFAQIMFFGALLSAIMSTASGTLMAPSVTFVENVLKHFMPKMSDRQFVRILRFTILVAAVSTTAFALMSDASIYEMVGNAYQITLVAAVVPLFAGLFWKKATTQGALVSMVLGTVTWVALSISYTDDAFWPPQLAGLLMALLGMLIGTLAPQWVPHSSQTEAKLQTQGA